nr:hypothetical protein P5645_22050 [Bacillus subtilis]WGD74656.1 hypothetical protein P5631_00030 [Bacillus subtilis]
MRKILHNIGDNTVKYWMYSIIASLFIVLIGFFLRSSVMLEIGYLLAPLSFIFMASNPYLFMYRFRNSLS